MLFLLPILVVLGVCGYVVFLFDGALGKEGFASDGCVAEDVIKIIKENNLEKALFYDLGSGHGSFAISIAKGLPDLSVVGIDDNWFRIAIAKIRSIFLKNLEFKKENIFSANLASANAIYIYLPQELMKNLQIKLQKELKHGSIIITNKVSFPDWQSIQTLNQLSIYAKK